MLAEEAAQAILKNRHEDGEAAAAQALELATRLGLDEQRASVLNTLGTIRFIDGDLRAADELEEQAFALAQPGSPQRFRALANSALNALAEGDVDAWRPRHARALEHATRTGDLQSVRWLECDGIEEAIAFGRWDEALRRIDAFLTGGPHYREDNMRLQKAAVLAARGATDEVRTLREEALELAARTEDHQVVIPTYLMSAWVSLQLGETARARELVLQAEIPGRDLRYKATGIRAMDAVAIAETGRGEAWLEIHAGWAPTRRQVAAGLVFAGRAVEGADAWARVSPHDEAVARLHAARRLAAEGRTGEVDVQIERGLAFFRAVGAKKIVRDAEGLLSAAASQSS